MRIPEVKRKRTMGCVALMLVLSSACAFAQSERHSATCRDQQSVQPFLGRWDLTLKTPVRKYPSWLGLSQHNCRLKATIVGRWGGACPASKVDVRGGVLTFASPKEGDCDTNVVFKGKLADGKLEGTATGPKGTPWTWTGEKEPALADETVSKWGQPIRLFNGKNLDGWHAYSAKESPQSGHWTVVNGLLVSPGQGPELVSNRKFDNFKLHVEFKLGPTSNSGVYLRGRYEVQIENDSANEAPSHHTGGVYGFIAPHPQLPRTTDQWQTFDITFIGRQVTVVQNGTTVIDNKEIPGITGGALDSQEGQPGPIMLQGSEKGHVSFRNVVITPALN